MARLVIFGSKSEARAARAARLGHLAADAARPLWRLCGSTRSASRIVFVDLAYGTTYFGLSRTSCPRASAAARRSAPSASTPGRRSARRRSGSRRPAAPRRAACSSGRCPAQRARRFLRHQRASEGQHRHDEGEAADQHREGAGPVVEQRTVLPSCPSPAKAEPLLPVDRGEGVEDLGEAVRPGLKMA